MIEYTQGPWSLCNWADTTANPGVASSVMAEVDGEEIEICRFDLFPEAGEQHAGNAQLILHAFEMYEALEAIAGNHDAGPGIDAAELCELITQRAREVLAKVRGDAKPVTELRAAVLSILGGVGAISPRLYGQALDRIAEITGRVNDDSFRSEVTECLRSVPCGLN